MRKCFHTKLKTKQYLTWSSFKASWNSWICPFKSIFSFINFSHLYSKSDCVVLALFLVTLHSSCKMDTCSLSFSISFLLKANCFFRCATSDSRVSFSFLALSSNSSSSDLSLKALSCSNSMIYEKNNKTLIISIIKFMRCIIVNY